MIDGGREPLDRRRIVARPVGAYREATEKVLSFASYLTDVAVLSWLGLTVGAGAWRAVQARGVMPLLWLAAFVESVAYGWRHGGGLRILTAGDDWLAYEAYSRAIALGDWIGAGHPDAFFYQPFYSYFLALTHLLFGDALFGAVFVQRLLLAATVAWVVRITTDLFGRRSGWIALVGGGCFLYAKIGAWTYQLLSENLFVPLLVGWVAILSRPAANGTPAGRAVAAGIVGGITTLTRSTLLLAWPPALLLWAASLKARRLQTVGALLIVMVAVVGTATLRNWVVSDKFVLVASSLGINLYLGNTPREPLGPEPPHRTRLYERFGVEGHVRTVAEFAAQRPGEFIQHLGNKALYTIGFFRRSQLPGGDNMRTSWLYVGTWAFAAAGVGRLILGVHPTSSPAVWIGAVTALTHFAVMVLVIPFGYGDRYILPLYPLLLPYAAFAIDALPGRFRQIAIGSTAGWSSVRRATAYPLASASARVYEFAQGVRRRPRTWLYAAYVATVCSWVPWQPATGQIDLLTALMLPAIALPLARLARSDRGHAALGTALWAAALLFIALQGSLAANALHDPLFWGVIAVVALVLSWAARRGGPRRRAHCRLWLGF